MIGVDFGTTNSVVAWLDADGTTRTATYPVGRRVLDVFRTVLCFHSAEILAHRSGPYAVDAYLDDPEASRLIMSMKTYLAQASFTRTNIFGRVFSLEQLVALFLRDLLPPGLAKSSQGGAGITAGRPVRFAGEFADDALGETRLREAFALAGHPSIGIALEPEAAGYRFARTLTAPATVLIGDFGGGTSDFSILRYDPAATTRVTPLGYAGIGIAGDSFDYRIIDKMVSPLLGKGDSYTIMGKQMPVPVDYFEGFARWHRLSMMRNPRTLRDIEQVAATTTHPERLCSLVRLIRDEQGYELYQAVSETKAALSGADAATLRFRCGDTLIERHITRQDFEAWIAPDLAALSATVDQALASAALPATAIERVFLTGGTAFVPAVRALFARRFGAAKLSGGGEFVSVAEGLALIGRDRAQRPNADPRTTQAPPGTWRPASA